MDQQFAQTLLHRYGVRATPAQKQAFLHFAARSYNFHHPALPQTGRNYTNLIFGDPVHAKTVIAAYYATPMRRFFPYIHFWEHPWLNLLQHVLPLSLLLTMSILLTAMLRWPWLSALCLFLPLALFSCHALYNPQNHNDSSGLIALHALAKQHPDTCIVLLDGKQGKRAFLKKYPAKPMLILYRVGRGDIPFLQLTKHTLQQFPDVGSLPYRRHLGKHGTLEIGMGERRPFGLSSGPLGIPTDTIFTWQSISQAISLADALLHGL